MDKNAKKKFQTEQMIYTIDLIDHQDHHEPHGHDDNHCCGSCKNQGTCSSIKSNEKIEVSKDNHTSEKA